MYKFIFIIALFFCSINQSNAQMNYQDINAFKYIYHNQGKYNSNINDYNKDEEFKSFFENVGFIWLDDQQLSNLSVDEKKYTLYFEYLFQKDYSKKMLNWGLVSHGGSFCINHHPEGSIKFDMNDVFNTIKNLNYKFNPSLLQTLENENVPFSYWNEGKIRHYLDSAKISPIEGIYKSLNNLYGSWKYAIIKYNNKFYSVVISDNRCFLWNKGNVKLVLSPIKPNIFDVDYYHMDYNSHSKDNGYANFDGITLNIVVNNQIKESFLKIYPNDGNYDDNVTQETSNSKILKATGSGVFVSDKIIATNYHVISDANTIQIELNDNGICKTYNATVLVSDKINDLALLSVNDKDWKNSMNPPFRILSKSVDVGTSIFTMGYPLSQYLGEEIKVTDGIISSKTGYQGDVVAYQISAAIQPGNSGGGLFDKEGNLIGITNAGIKDGENIGYAIKSSYLLNLIDSSPIPIDIRQTVYNGKSDLASLVKAFKSYVVMIKIY